MGKEYACTRISREIQKIEYQIESLSDHTVISGILHWN